MNFNSIRFSIIFSLFYVAISGCSTVQKTITTEKMLSDGKTWNVTVFVKDHPKARNCYWNNDCKSFVDSVLYRKMEKHGEELCGELPERIFLCAYKVEKSYASQTCYVKCSK